jgi:hypothetical protein
VPEHDRVVAAVRAALGERRFEELRSEGARMTLDEAIDLVLDGQPTESSPVHEPVQIRVENT